MKVLVTGASGFTGGSLARFLARQGDAVRALVRRRDRAGILAGLASIEIVEGDLTDRESLRRAVAGVDVVYNIARSIARPDCRPPSTAPSTRRPSARSSSSLRPPACAASCTAARSAFTATSGRRRPMRTRRSRRRPLSGDQARRRAGGPRGGGARRHGARDRAADRHLWAGRSAAVQDLRQDRHPPVRHARARHALLSRDVHRRLVRGLSPVRDGPRGGRAHLHPRRRGSDDAARAGRANGRGRRRASAALCGCPSGRSGWPARPARRSSRPSGCRRRSIGAV